MLAGQADQFLGVGPAHVVGDDLERGEVEQHAVESVGVGVAARLRHHVRHSGVHGERDLELAGLLVEGPHPPVVEGPEVLGLIDLAEPGAALLDQVLELPEGVLDTPPQDRPHHGLEVHAVGIGLDLLHDEGVGGEGNGLPADVHHPFAQGEADVDPRLVHVLDQLARDRSGPLGLPAGEVPSRPGAHHAVDARPPAAGVGVVVDLRQGLRIHQVALGQGHEGIALRHASSSSSCATRPPPAASPPEPASRAGSGSPAPRSRARRAEPARR